MCACSIGNKVLVTCNTDVRFFFFFYILESVPASRCAVRAEAAVAVADTTHEQLGENATLARGRCLRANERREAGRVAWDGRGEGYWARSCPPLRVSGIVLVYGSHAQTRSLFLLLHNINDTAQACHTACTSKASALGSRGPTKTLHTSLEAMPAASGY